MYLGKGKKWLLERQIKAPEVLYKLSELLNGEIFNTILKARVITENWRQQNNKVKPHSSLGYRPPAPEAILPLQIAGA